MSNQIRDKRFISVIIATYNRTESLKETLDSLSEQDCDGSYEYEVIVADNNSNDKTKETVESYKNRFNGKLKYLFEPRQGKPYALNRGIEEAKGEIIAFTDDDCIVDKRWVNEIVETFKKNDLGIVGGIINPVWLSPKPRWLSDKLYGKLAIQNYGESPFIVSSKSQLPFGANISFRKNLFYKYGLFNERMKFAMDTEICLRLFKNRVKIFYNPRIIVNHKIDSSRMKKRYFYQWSYRRGLLYQYRGGDCIGKKFYHLFGIPLWVILHLLKEAVESMNIFITETERVCHRSVLFGYIGMISTKFKSNLYNKNHVNNQRNNTNL